MPCAGLLTDNMVVIYLCSDRVSKIKQGALILEPLEPGYSSHWEKSFLEREFHLRGWLLFFGLFGRLLKLAWRRSPKAVVSIVVLRVMVKAEILFVVLASQHRFRFASWPLAIGPRSVWRARFGGMARMSAPRRFRLSRVDRVSVYR